MLTRGEADRNNQERSQQGVSIPCKRLRAIAYSMDAPRTVHLVRSVKIRLGGSEAEETYSGTIHSFAGMALVLPVTGYTAPIGDAMTLDKHQIDGLAQISSKSHPTLNN